MLDHLLDLIAASVRLYRRLRDAWPVRLYRTAAGWLIEVRIRRRQVRPAELGQVVRV